MLKLNQFLSGLVVVLFLGICLDASAQSKSYSNIFIPEKAFVSIFGEHSFIEGGTGVNPGMISTARKGSKGYVNFAAGSSWSGASDVQFIDGYVRVYHDNPFVFPIGANGKYRPVSISGGAKTSAAYFDRNPAKVAKGATGNKAATVSGQVVIERLSDAEYWEIEGDKATNITVSWGVDSKIDELTQSDLSKLSIVGWKNGQWRILSSTYDINKADIASHTAADGSSLSSFAVGSISTREEVIPSEYDYFTLAGINVSTVAKPAAFSMFPNPRLTTMPLNVSYQLPTEGGILRIFSANGAVIAERDLSNSQGTITLTDVTNAPGAYNVSITDGEGKTLSKKLIVVAE